MSEKKMATFYSTCFENYISDEHGFLYKKQAGGVMKPIAPRRHWLCSHTGDFRFYITVNGKKYSISQTNLREMKNKAVWKLEK